MMPEEWPIAAPAADGSDLARPAGRGRLPTVRVDFFLDPAKRLTEQERALMTVMLHELVRDLANALRAALPGGWLAANDDDDAALVATLTRAGLLDEPGLMALLLRRADEERISVAARARGGRREARVLQGLVANEQGAVAAAAMALILARGRRRDRFGQCLVASDDLPPQAAGSLLNIIAAALRTELAASRGAPDADRELTIAVKAVARQRDQARSVATLTEGLIRDLDEAGSLTDELMLAAASEGELGFIAAALARRAASSVDGAMDELLSGEAGTIMALFRAASASRDLAAGLLAAIGDLLGVTDAGEAIARFDAMSRDDIDAARSWLDTDPAYRAALDRLGPSRG